jgi:hypothetical protein
LSHHRKYGQYVFDPERPGRLPFKAEHFYCAAIDAMQFHKTLRKFAVAVGVNDLHGASDITLQSS